jgi:ApbE superfamily uncharacterized protein (UPF0280 family)
VSGGGAVGGARAACGAGARRARLAADRWHFQHGPIDLIIDVDAAAALAEALVDAAWERFPAILPDLVTELGALRRPACERPAFGAPVLGSCVAGRMQHACAPFARHRFITPMAAVAGAVADELIGIFNRPGVRRAAINNGGDIALTLSPGARYRVGIWSRLDRAMPPTGSEPLDGNFTITADMPVRGIATSGWRGRSFSLGIADSVTVLAANAAAADAAATLIANAVDCDDPGIRRAPADELKDDTDLGSRLVTVDVPPLPDAAVAAALAAGRLEASHWLAAGAIHAAAIFLQGRTEVVMPHPRATHAAATLEAVL